MEKSEKALAIWPATMARDNDRNNTGNWEHQPTRRRSGQRQIKHEIDRNKRANKTTTNSCLKSEPPNMGVKMRKHNTK